MMDMARMEEVAAPHTVSAQTISLALRHAFLQGAKFWEFHATGGTMWQAGQAIAFERAKEMMENGALGAIEGPDVRLYCDYPIIGVDLANGPDRMVIWPNAEADRAAEDEG